MSTRKALVVVGAAVMIAVALAVGSGLFFSILQQPVQSSSALPLPQTSTEAILLDNSDNLHVISVEDVERGVVCYVAYAETNSSSGFAANPSIHCLVLPAN